jgi:hypothetical protein
VGIFLSRCPVIREMIPSQARICVSERYLNICGKSHGYQIFFLVIAVEPSFYQLSSLVVRCLVDSAVI